MSEHTVNGGARAVNQKRRTRNIPYKIKREIWSMPCTICGGREDVLVDHIIPYSKGGTNDRSNLQPLCWICNAKKGNRLTNDQLRAWFEANREDILLRHDYRRETRYVNEYDGVSFEFWKRARLARLGRNTANG
jgi:5-methylcytosine-specific restriction endonuclease McrA